MFRQQESYLVLKQTYIKFTSLPLCSHDLIAKLGQIGTRYKHSRGLDCVSKYV